nr:immunoglobulin heavy chain junction region [Mus musculus]
CARYGSRDYFDYW